MQQDYRACPQSVAGIERKSWLKWLGITFQENRCCLDVHVENLIGEPSSWLCLRIASFIAVLKTDSLGYLTL